MKNETYNGWSNWDTWNANLHLTNDYNVYNEAINCETAKDIRLLFLESFDTGQNEYDGIDYGCVNWHEILEGLKS